MPRLSVIVGCALLLGGCLPPANPFGRRVRDEGVSGAALNEARRMDAIATAIDDGAFAQAQRQLDEALAAGVAHPRAFFLQGRLLQERGQVEEAVPWLRRAVEASPRWPEPRLRLAGIALERLRWAEADQAFTDIDALWPEHPAGPWGRGMVAQARQQQERSCELLDESLRRDADFLPAVKARAALAARERDTATARHLYQRAVALAPSETALLLALADLDEGEGRLDDARRGLAAAWRLSGDRALARRLATLARRQGDLAEAQRWEGIAGMPAPAPDSETRPLSEAEGDPRGQP